MSWTGSSAEMAGRWRASFHRRACKYTFTLATLLQSLSQDEYYVSHEAAIDAFKRRTQFNIIDLATGWKVDLMVLKRRAFSSEELRRRMPARILEVEVFVATAEDTILTKLEWSVKSGSERQLQDAASIIAIKGEELVQGKER